MDPACLTADPLAALFQQVPGAERCVIDLAGGLAARTLLLVNPYAARVLPPPPPPRCAHFREATGERCTNELNGAYRSTLFCSRECERHDRPRRARERESDEREFRAAWDRNPPRAPPAVLDPAAPEPVLELEVQLI